MLNTHLLLRSAILATEVTLVWLLLALLAAAAAYSIGDGCLSVSVCLSVCLCVSLSVVNNTNTNKIYIAPVILKRIGAQTHGVTRR